ncbi:hypothetical protein [Microcoleus sp.]|uniref:hypothetical protein n=1 Tax=Microcoleus sp. TaxID=44472 RepID=UPI00403EA19D
MDTNKHFAKNELFQFAQDGFLTEADSLAQTATAPDFRQLLKFFENYGGFLLSGRLQYFGDCFFEELKTLKTIDFSTPSEHLLKLKHAINLAAACDLFNGWSLAVGALNANQLRVQVKQAVKDMGESKSQTAEILARKLNSGDASRVIHMLKIFGWIAPDMANSRQLSLGASGGTRDRFAIHQMPTLRYQQNNPLLRESILEMVSFNMDRQTAGNIVLVDNDPGMQSDYQKLNEEPNILALNLDANKAMDELKSLISNNDVAPRTFVLAFRIDHRMIPDTGDFLRRMGAVIDDTADLVVTMGAGHTNSEFKGRLEKISELETSLIACGLNPVKIRWCCGKTLSEQRSNPIFGAPTYATYEILYCKLSKSALLALE